MPDHEIFKEHDPEDCFYSCRTVHDFMRLTDEMVHTPSSVWKKNSSGGARPSSNIFRPNGQKGCGQTF